MSFLTSCPSDGSVSTSTGSRLSRCLMQCPPMPEGLVNQIHVLDIMTDITLILPLARSNHRPPIQPTTHRPTPAKETHKSLAPPTADAGKRSAANAGTAAVDRPHAF